ncbi:unnamed protein product, partial [Rotaria sp. Silwood1]
MCSGFVRQYGWEYYGKDIAPSPLQAIDYTSCYSKCQNTSRCTAFTYSQSAQQCWPKTDIGNDFRPNGDRISAYNHRGCPNFVPQIELEYYGNDLTSSPVEALDYASCCSKCQATQGCDAFTYSNSRKKCWLKTGMGNDIRENKDTISGYTHRGCPNFVLQVGWDYYGNDIPPFPVPVPDYAGCCSQCEATIGCNAFAYSPSSRDCWLKTGMGHDLRQNDDRISAHKHRGCPNFVLQVGWDYYGNDIPPFPVPVPDYAGCCSQCEATIGCNAFAYSPSSRDCWLKTGMGHDLRQNDDRISAHK